jgi:hypothetical protein
MHNFYSKPENLNNAEMNLPAGRQKCDRVQKLCYILHLSNIFH